MPKRGSVNKIELSDLTTTSFGEFRRLPSYRSQTVVMLPSHSVPLPQRERCSPVTSRPCLSRVLPLAWLDGLRKKLTVPVSSSQRRMQSPGTSLHNKQRPSPNQTGPSPQRAPV